MKRTANYALFGLQWLLVIWGLFTAVTALQVYAIESAHFDGVSTGEQGSPSFAPPIFHRLVVGLCTGFASVGIGGVLFYLRRLYLREEKGS